MSLKVNALPDLPNRKRGAHWSEIKRSRDQWQLVISAALTGKKPKTPLRRARLHFVRHSERQPDYDNLVASFKIVQDSLVSAQVLEDDKPAMIGYPTYEWQFAPAKKGFITALVEELPGA